MTLTHIMGLSYGRSLASNTDDEWNGPATWQCSDAPRMHALRADMDQLRFALPGQQQLTWQTSCMEGQAVCGFVLFHAQSVPSDVPACGTGAAAGVDCSQISASRTRLPSRSPRRKRDACAGNIILPVPEWTSEATNSSTSSAGIRTKSRASSYPSSMADST